MLDHRRQGVFDQQKRADQIRVEHLPKIFHGIIEQVRHWRRPNGRCVIHQHVELAFELRQSRRNDPLDVARLAHVCLDGDDVDLRRELA